MDRLKLTGSCCCSNTVFCTFPEALVVHAEARISKKVVSQGAKVCSGPSVTSFGSATGVKSATSRVTILPTIIAVPLLIRGGSVVVKPSIVTITEIDVRPGARVVVPSLVVVSNMTLIGIVNGSSALRFRFRFSC